MPCNRSIISKLRSGFTLIELLVVVAIIAILAAILFPVFAQAKAAAKKTVCLSNTKQIALCTLLYTNDYDDTAPFGCNLVLENNDYHFIFWFADDWYDDNFNQHFTENAGLLWPYEKNGEIQACPIAESELTTILPPNFPVGFGVNGNVMPNEQTLFGGGFIPPAVMTQISAPAETILIADAAAVLDSYTGPAYIAPQEVLLDPIGEPATTLGDHNGQTNIAWADGHAHSMPVTVRPQNFVYDQQEYGGDVRYHVGDVVNSKYPLGDPWFDYFYNTDKPN